MAESQNIEYKESWRDEYLKWICGFANAQGGKIYIGIDDNGKIVGVKDSKKLMEDIPNKIRDTLGIVADVNLLKKESKEYIEISVLQSAYPINYKGEYHYRSGSTKQLLQGTALTQFLLSKTGTKWESVTVDNVKTEDLDKESFDIFKREALKSQRMTKADLAMTNEELLDSLHLLQNGKLTRAAVLLFYREPERWYKGCYVKIGYFGLGSDLQYQDEIHGSLMILADRTVELIYLKYLKAFITYDNLIRVETYPIPKDAMREAVYNALIHSNYASGSPIQIRIHEDQIYISNDCVFPTGWTEKTLLGHHRSELYNPDIAKTFFRAGYVESWGRGIQKICELCKEADVPEPEYIVHPYDIMLCFKTKVGRKIIETDEKLPVNELQTTQKTTQKTTQNLTDSQINILNEIMNNPQIGRKELAQRISSISEDGVKYNLKALQQKKIIKREGPDKGGYWKIIQQEDKGE